MCSWVRRHNFIHMLILYNLIFRFYTIPINSSKNFGDTNKLILKFIWKVKGTRISKIILKKNKIRRLILLHFKTYYSPDWCGSLGWPSSLKPRGHWFDSQSGHMPGLWARFLVVAVH